MTKFFPPLAWAFPQGKLKQLIYAAVGADTNTAQETFKKWLSENNFEDVDHKITRLLIAIIARHGAALQSIPEYARLIGIQRLMWSRAQMAHNHNLDGLGILAAANIDWMLIKGSSITLLPYSSRKERISHDMDVVVAPGQFSHALKALLVNGWISSSGKSNQRIICEAENLRSVNLFKSQFGDIDLHRIPFHELQGKNVDDNQFWHRGQTKVVGKMKIKLPSPEDMIMIAIAHGGFDGHTHSDWMVDCAKIIQNETIDWDLLLNLITARDVVVASSVIFTHLKEELQLNIDENFRKQLDSKLFKVGYLQYLTELVQIRPRESFSKLGQVLRFLAKTYRKSLMNATKKKSRTSNSFDLKIVKTNVDFDACTDTFSVVKKLPIHENFKSGHFKAKILIEPCKTTRRIEFEINSLDTHHGHTKLQIYRKRDREIPVSIYGIIDKHTQKRPIILESRNSRHPRSNASEQDKMRYGALKFKLVSFEFTSSHAEQ
ncbi:MAG: nucleotidyltransferase family protein [Rhodothermales bacterium]